MCCWILAHSVWTSSNDQRPGNNATNIQNIAVTRHPFFSIFPHPCSLLSFASFFTTFPIFVLSFFLYYHSYLPFSNLSSSFPSHSIPPFFSLLHSFTSLSPCFCNFFISPPIIVHLYKLYSSTKAPFLMKAPPAEEPKHWIIFLKTIRGVDTVQYNTSSIIWTLDYMNPRLSERSLGSIAHAQ